MLSIWTCLRFCHLEKGLLFTKRQNLRLVQIQSIADDSINVTQIFKFVLETAENIVGVGEKAGYQHFHLFPQCFQKALSQGC